MGYPLHFIWRIILAKSTVYGTGRNRKHRALSGPWHPSAGGINMHGKKLKLMGCRCCYCIDMRDDLKRKEDMRTIRDIQRHPGFDY